jgi:putative transposase
MTDEQMYKLCKRLNEPGHAHALTFTCFRGQQFLSKNRPRRWLVDAIDRARSDQQFHLWAYVIMPEHVHLLLWPTIERYSISRILSSIKQSVAKRAIFYLRRQAQAKLRLLEDRQPNGKLHYRFWQRGGGYDRNITEPTTIWAEIDYIHANPVRRGLCQRSIEWIWSSAIEYEFPGTGLLRIDKSSLPRTVDG